MVLKFSFAFAYQISRRSEEIFRKCYGLTDGRRDKVIYRGASLLKTVFSMFRDWFRGHRGRILILIGYMGKIQFSFFLIILMLIFPLKTVKTEKNRHHAFSFWATIDLKATMASPEAGLQLCTATPPRYLPRFRRYAPFLPKKYQKSRFSSPFSRAVP